MKNFVINLKAAIECFFSLLNNSKEKVIGQILTERNYTIATAESCTGGLLSSLLTDVSGSSNYVKANFVTYANEAKTLYLNVDKKILDTVGAVSPETAAAMVKGLLKNTTADIAAATTGIAGPAGGSIDKPVGLVYIAVGDRDNISVKRFNVDPATNRRLVKIKFAKEAVEQIYEFLKQKFR